MRLQQGDGSCVVSSILSTGGIGDGNVRGEGKKRGRAGVRLSMLLLELSPFSRFCPFSAFLYFDA